MTVIRGSIVRLRPARESDRRAVYSWLAESDLTGSMMGPPTYPDSPPPTWDEFCADYGPQFFDGSTPRVEASYIIEVRDEALGQVNYEVREAPLRYAELDIWLRSEGDTGHGYGSDALAALTAHLSATLGIRTFLLRPSARNRRAIRAYQKAGFVLVPMAARQQVETYGPGDYDDSVVLIMEGSTERVPPAGEAPGGYAGERSAPLRLAVGAPRRCRQWGIVLGVHATATAQSDHLARRLHRG